MEIFGTLSSSLCLSLFIFLCFPYFFILSSPTKASIRSTIRMYNAELIDATQPRKMQVQNDRQIVYVFMRARARLRCRNCMCSVFISVRDGQRLDVLGSARVKCQLSHMHSEVCRLSYRLLSLADRHVETSMKALLSFMLCGTLLK
jgi:hypothetical protein